MSPLSHVTIVWSAIASTALFLAIVHFVRGMMSPRSRVDLLFAFTALSFVGVAYTELQSMYARTPEEWAYWVRWCYLPVSGMIVGLVLFVRQYFGTGRWWLAATVIGLRGVILAINGVHEPAVSFDRIDSLARIPFLGETVSVVGQAQTSSWQWLGSVATLLLVVYVVDAAVSLWRRGGPDERQRAAVIGGAVLLYACVGGLYVQLVIWRLTTLPLLITPTFGIIVIAMAYELSNDTFRVARLVHDFRETQRRLELAASSVAIGLWEWNSRTNRVWTSRQARAIFGFGDREVDEVGAWLARIHPDDAPRFRSAIQARLAPKQDYDVEFRIVHPDFGTRWISARGRSELVDGALLVRGVLRDASERKRTEIETQELRRELAHVGRVSMLGQLASSLAHELSQPLGAILRNAEAAELVLREPNPDLEELKAIIADIGRDDRRAGEVIDRLRSLLKRRALHVQPFPAEAMLQDIGTLVGPDAASRHVTIEWLVDAGLPAIHGDRVHLSQVLINLIINGMDAVSTRDPANRRVSVRARRDADGAVELTVQDSGPGVPADCLPRVFEPFFTTKSAGMGMGLAVSRTIVEAHGGRISVENAPEGGAVFRVSLPAEAQA